MKAKKSTRYLTGNRTDLRTAIPLATPIVVVVDPSSDCNFGCVYCPCGKAGRSLWREGRAAGTMSYELCRKVIDDMLDFPGRINTLRFYKDGEPLMNRRLPDMIHYARKKNVADRIDFTTNASLLNHDLSLALIDAGLSRINISVNALTSSRYEEVCGVRIDMDRFIENIEFLHKNSGDCRIFLKTTDVGLDGEDPQRFYEMFGNICDEIAIEYVSPSWPDFGFGSLESRSETNIYGDAQARESLVCPFIFYQICVNYDGSVSPCFADWNHKLLIGDVNKESLVEIWNGPAMKAIRLPNLLGLRSELDVCNRCGQLAYCAIDSIDDVRNDILERMYPEQGKTTRTK